MAKNCLLLLLLLVASKGIHAQQQEVYLPDFLKELENRFDIRFTYADINVRNIKVDRPPKDFDLKQILSYLYKATGLEFRQLEDNFIAIVKEDIPLVTICGTIIDAISKESVVGATIRVADRFTISDDHGYFVLENIEADQRVSINSLTYLPLFLDTDELNKDPCDTIILQPEILTLEEVSITTILTEGISRRIDGSLVVQTQELGILPGLVDPDVLQTIQAIPGINSIDETVSDINVRGGTNDQNLVLWNGIKMYQTGHFFGLISAYNPYLTDKVNLIKNGTSAMLGDGVSSTIDIRSNQKVSEEFTAGVGVNMLNADVYAKIPISKKASAQFSTRRSFADLFQTPTYDKYFERAFRETDVFQNIGGNNGERITANENFNFFDISGGLVFNLTQKDKLEVNVLHISNEIDYNERATVNNILETKTSGLDQQSLVSNVVFSHLWNEKVRTTAQVFASNYQLRAVNFDIFNNQRVIQKNEVLDTGIKLDSRLALSNEVDLLVGYQFFETGVSNFEDVNNPAFTRNIKKVNRNHAVFSESSLTSTSGNTNLRVGIRANLFPDFEEVLIEPRLVFNQKLFRNFTWEILGEFKSQITSQIIDFQNDFLGIEKRRWTLANNADIPITKSKQISSGIYYKKEGLLISLHGYFKNVRGITASSQGFLDQLQFAKSIGSYDAIGLDLLINRQFKNISLWTGYSNAKNTYTFNDFIPSEFPNNLDIKHLITVGSSYTSQHFKFSVGLNWHSGRPYTEALEIVNDKIGYGEPNALRLEDYLRLDLSAKYEFTLAKSLTGQFGVSVWNVLDETNVLNKYYALNNGIIKVIDKKALGITPNAVVRIFLN